MSESFTMSGAVKTEGAGFMTHLFKYDAIFKCLPNDNHSATKLESFKSGVLKILRFKFCVKTTRGIKWKSSVGKQKAAKLENCIK